ncbi:MAG: Hsp70 family protein [Clostridia bacterium]
MSKHVFGIDLGTTNSCIAVMRGSESDRLVPQIITFEDGSTTLPSCVWYKPTSKDKSKDEYKVIIGREAYRNRHLTDEVVYSSKRKMGTQEVYTLHGGNLIVTPVDVATHILATLKKNAERMYGEGQVTDVVITVPAYFDHNERVDTRTAAEGAGLNVIALINEPTSAALAYSLGKSASNERILVYDFGGGTFDVTLLDFLVEQKDTFGLFEDDSNCEPVANVISSAGHDRLGGDDLDRAVLEASIDVANAEMNAKDKIKDFDVRKYITPEMYERLLLAVEQHKKLHPASTIVQTIKVKLGRGEKEVQLGINAKLFKKALQPIYARTKDMITTCAGTLLPTVSKLILVGGSTKLCFIREMLHEDFPNLDIYAELNPDEAVALGAAVQASIINGDVNMLVSDVLPHSIGIDCHMDMNGTKLDGRFKKLILKDTDLPTEMSTVVTNIEDDQKEITVAFYQGENARSVENTYLGSVRLTDVQLKKSGESDIELRVRIDANGILSVGIEAEGKSTTAVLENILVPLDAEEQTLSQPIRNMLNSLKSALRNADVSEDDKEPLYEELEKCTHNPKLIPGIKAKIQGLTSKTFKQKLESATSFFSDKAAMNTGAVSFGDDAGAEKEMEE